MIYYDNTRIKVRSAKKSDIAHLARNMRECDVQEVWASDHKTPEEAIKESLDNSIFACTVENGVPIAAFGIHAPEILGTSAYVWMLATNDLEKIRIRFAMNSRKFIDMMLEYYPYLHNYVDARNTSSIEWLRFCGATIEEARPFGEDGLMFHHFYFEKGK